jgi:hypothetical protein
MNAEPALSLFLQATIPVLIAELVAAGSATEAELDRVKGYVEDFNIDSKTLPSRREGKTVEMGGNLVDALAAPASSVEFAGLHFEAQHEGDSR